MPILPQPSYSLPFPFSNGHVQTLFPTLFRQAPDTAPHPERIDTPDGDFLDLDWHYAPGGPHRRLAIVTHGLEGHSRKKYPLGMAAALTQSGWDVVCRTLRGCSAEPNRTLRSYHSGETEDLHTVVSHVLETGKYDELALIGFSLGGNQTLKYLGEDPARVPSEVTRAVAYSVPCDLAGCADVLDLPSRRVYMEYFMRGLRQKTRLKAEMFPGTIDLGGLDEMTSFWEYDDRFTAPIHGFQSAADYYEQSSSLRFLPAIRVPTLLVNAVNDVFLTPSCYPTEAARHSKHLFLEMPRTGGHVGFVQFNRHGLYWSERRAVDFLEK
ncbi:YheT family hydrolase [Salidesulfovibrio onnuriiensis]|uniref:YheT family hydrolase n=1 Tax=Salidesulfovibrio onnuriiensis TaxID=2583823 RepID=UPI0011C98301|nr:alpha/beta fold hydrolase [Salidesulfovibrio onnuriiensis]